jgi:hypothetical protein
MISSRLQLERFLVANGHLVLEGDESIIDLREALLYLRQHTYQNCHRPEEFGTPIVAFTPDISVLTGSPMGRRPAKRVVLHGESPL